MSRTYIPRSSASCWGTVPPRSRWTRTAIWTEGSRHQSRRNSRSGSRRTRRSSNTVPRPRRSGCLAGRRGNMKRDAFEQVKIVTNEAEVSALVQQLAEWLFPSDDEMVPLSRAFAILQALSLTMGAIIANCAYGVFEDQRNRSAVILDQKAL